MQGERAEKRGRWGRSWWGARPLAWYEYSNRSGTNKFFKRLLHKKERVINKDAIDQQFVIN